MSRPTFPNFRNKALSKPSVNEEYLALKPASELRKKLIEIRNLWLPDCY